MGIAIPQLVHLLNERKLRDFKGTVLQIGRQDIYFDYASLQSVAKQMGVTLRKPDKIGVKKNEWMPNVNTIDEQTLFQSLGFEHVQSIDASDYENADYVHDFNQLLPQSFDARFDLIFDEGSLEHIFHVPNALTNINTLLKEGGRIIHHAPTHNFVDHGFYCLQPTLFYDYYEADAYADIRCFFVGWRLPFKHNEMPKFFPYKPMGLEHLSVGGITKESCEGCELFVTMVSATKTAQSRGNVIPTQRRYQQWWAKAKSKISAGLPTP